MAYSTSYPRPKNYGPPPAAPGPETAALAGTLVADLRSRGVSPTQSAVVVDELTKLRAGGIGPATVAAVAEGWASHRSSGVDPVVAKVVGGKLTKLKGVGIGPAVVAEVAQALARQSVPTADALEMAAAAQRDPGSFEAYAARAAHRRAIREQRSGPAPDALVAQLGEGGRILGADAAARIAAGRAAAAAHAGRYTA
jgi:hypothetical protein